MTTISKGALKPDPKLGTKTDVAKKDVPKDVKGPAKAQPKKMSPQEEQAMIDAAIVDFSTTVKDDPELKNMDSPTYSPKELRAKAMMFMKSPKASPEERAALESALGGPKKK